MDKTVSRETAKKLKEAGWPQGTTDRHQADGSVPLNPDRPVLFFDAPDVSELLEALPDFVSLDRQYSLVIRKDDGALLARYERHEDIVADGLEACEKCPAEALASLWLELKSKNLI